MNELLRERIKNLNLYAPPEEIATQTTTENPLQPLQMATFEYDGFQGLLDVGDIEILPFSNEEAAALEIINHASRTVLRKYGIHANPSLDCVFMYRLPEMINVDNGYGGIEQKPKGYEDRDDLVLPDTFFDPSSGRIAIRDILLRKPNSKDIDIPKLQTTYAHELGHMYGIPHEIMRDSHEENIILGARATGFYLSSYFQNEKGSGYRSLTWVDEAANVYLQGEIKYEAGLSPTPEPQDEDWGGRFDVKHLFNQLTNGLSMYLRDSKNYKDFFTLKMLCEPSKFDFETADYEKMKKFMVFARLNRSIHTGLVYLLYSIYSQKPAVNDNRYANVWQVMLDDVLDFLPNFPNPNIDYFSGNTQPVSF